MIDGLYLTGCHVGSVIGLTLHGVPALGRFAIDAQFTLSLRETETHPFPRVVAAGGLLDASATAVAHFERVVGDWRSFADQPGDHRIVLRAIVDGSVVQALDRRRAPDGSLNLSVKLIFEVEKPDVAIETRALLARLTQNQHVVDEHARLVEFGTVPSYPPSFIERSAATVDTSVSLTRSDWTRILSGMQWEERVLLEIPVSGGKTIPRFAKVAEHLRKALHELDIGHWSDALLACREALDVLESIDPNQPPPTSEWSDSKKQYAWDVSGRLAVARWAVRHITHAGAHQKIGVVVEREARTAVHLTASIYLHLLG